jgi:2-aminoadipate transaminase
MRLNFSGVGEDDIREGIRRIGEVVREQVGLYGTLTGARAVSTAAAPPTRPAASRSPGPDAPVPEPDPELAKILQLPAKRRAG